MVKKQRNRLSMTSFFQQNMMHCVPDLNISILMIIYFIVAGISCFVGISCIILQKKLFLGRITHTNNQDTNWIINITNVHNNLYLYQYVIGFKQNTRTYITSFDLKQLKKGQFLRYINISSSEIQLEPKGLLYQSRLEDIIDISADGQKINTITDRINYNAYLVQNKVYGTDFKQLPHSSTIINWMQPAINHVIKLYTIIPYDQIKNKTELTINIHGNYNPNIQFPEQTYDRVYMLEEVSFLGSHQTLSSFCIVSCITFSITLIFAIFLMTLAISSKYILKNFNNKANVKQVSALTQVQTVEMLLYSNQVSPRFPVQ